MSTLRRVSNDSVDFNDTSGLIPTSPIVANAAEHSIRHQRSVSNASVIAGGAGEKSAWHGDSSITSTALAGHNDGRGRSQNLEIPASQRYERSASEKPTRRRKKTLNQLTPHRFELIDAKRDSIRPPVPNGYHSATPSEEILIMRTRDSRRSSVQDVLDFSGVRSVASVEAQQPKPKQERRGFSRINVNASITPIEPIGSPTPPVSARASPKRRSGGGFNFPDGNPMAYGLPEYPLVTSPMAAVAEPRSVSRESDASSPPEPYIYRPSRVPLPRGSLMNKVVIVTNGISVISAPLVRQLHQAGARVIFSAAHDQSDKARAFIRELGPPDTIHFNACDLSRYADIHALFKLGMTMYGRIDHAIFSSGDDGGQASGIGAAERLWGLEIGTAAGRTMTSKAELHVIERGEIRADQTNMANIIGASVRFARIAIAYLRNSPGRRQRHSTGDSFTPTSPGFTDSAWDEDRSLTFVSSTAAFTPIPYLPVYSTTQHAILGLVRSLGESIDVRRDGVRVNLIATNMLLPSVVEARGGGKMSVRLPNERGEDISNIIAGVIGDEAARKQMHARVLYATGDEAVDIQEGLNKSEHVWLGNHAKKELDHANGKWEGLGNGRWMLMDSLDSPF